MMPVPQNVLRAAGFPCEIDLVYSAQTRHYTLSLPFLALCADFYWLFDLIKPFCFVKHLQGILYPEWVIIRNMERPSEDK